MASMTDPFSGGFDPRLFENVPLFRELAKVMAWSGGPVNWELASQTALAIAAPSGEEAPDEREQAELAQAVDVAELWLDQTTELRSPGGQVQLLSKAAWVRLACRSDGLGVYVEPVAEGMSQAFGRQMGEAAGLPEQFQAMAGPMAQAMNSMGAMLYGVQIGTIAGGLAEQLLTGYDLGVPTLDPATIATVGANAAAFARDFGFEETEFRYWLALREAAHRRQFAGVRWLREEIGQLIRRFAGEADFDPNALLDQLGGMAFDPSDPTALQAALEQPDAFRVEPTQAQRDVLGRIQAVVAFTEAWVDTVVEAAAGDKLPSLGRIEEAMLRRRAEKGPGERFLEQLVGLTLRPGDVRAGRQFCAAVVAARGQEGLDRVWRHPGYLPAPEELEEPSLWLVRMAAAELDDPGEPAK